jgi:hypothetical protein
MRKVMRAFGRSARNCEFRSDGVTAHKAIVEVIYRLSIDLRV